ncbi:hypothetical protein [Serratia sp. 1D1416]|uniref:hypothetical protein n=1 Tax=Serratia sp. 1D1416 TaxID=2447890 RepID=UPI001013CDFD|nr:hypothetical protein [Serratia sp. 1D1416]
MPTTSPWPAFYFGIKAKNQHITPKQAPPGRQNQHNKLANNFSFPFLQPLHLLIDNFPMFPSARLSADKTLIFLTT